MERVTAPFTTEQVTSLNNYQVSGFFHPFTCGKRDDHPDHPIDRGLLVAFWWGWECSWEQCDYEQDWAHEWMADNSWRQLNPFTNL